MSGLLVTKHGVLDRTHLMLGLPPANDCAAHERTDAGSGGPPHRYPCRARTQAWQRKARWRSGRTRPV